MTGAEPVMTKAESKYRYPCSPPFINNMLSLFIKRLLPLKLDTNNLKKALKQSH